MEGGSVVRMRFSGLRADRVAALGALAVLLLLVVCGCGGGDSAAAGSATITKAEFIERADAICSRALEEQETVVAAAERKLGHGGPVSSKQRERLLIALAPQFFERKTEDLAKLPVPVGGEAQVRAIIVGYEAGVREIEARPVTVVRGTPFLRGRKAAGRYGLSECD
jgi:hypothetical protein